MYSEPDRLRALVIDHRCRLHEAREERKNQMQLDKRKEDSEKITDIEISMWQKAAASEGGAGEVLVEMNIDQENAFQYVFHLYAFDRKHGTNRVRAYLDSISSKLTTAAQNNFEFSSNTFSQL